MKKAQIITLGVAVVFGAAALVGMSMLTKEPVVQTQTVEINTTEVLVARTDINLGQVANASSFRWQKWPKDAVSGKFITRRRMPSAVSKFSGAIARSPLLQGEPVTPHKLIRAGEGGVLAAILPQGMRAISTRIKEDTAAGRLILPNDRVDVILTRRLRNRGSDGHVSDTLFRNVRVLAIGQMIDAKNKKSADASTATLELTPQQAEQLALANSMGEISLALRSVADFKAAGADPTSGSGLRKDRGNAIRVLRYGVKSRAYGVN
ncbi:MAG: Flp pilus assembly protein CpaB [Pseudomonadota bacterium]